VLVSNAPSKGEFNSEGRLKEGGVYKIFRILGWRLKEGGVY